MNSLTSIKLDQLTSLRFFAAAMIVIHHSAGLFGFGTPPTPFILGQGVSFFFVLSGFILAYVYPKLSTFSEVRRFLYARFARIWPAHVVTFLLAFWLLSHKWNTEIALANLTLVHAWIPQQSYFFSYNAPSWSISAEFFFYLVFPVLIYRWERNWLIKILLSAGILLALIVYSMLTHLPSHGSTLLYINPVSRIFEFIFGIFIAFYWRSNKDKIHWSMQKATILELAVILLSALSMYYIRHVVELIWVYWPNNTFAQWFHGSGSMFIFGLMIYIMAIGRGKFSQILMHPHLVLLGEISFSMYLLHQILLRYYHVNLDFFPQIPNLAAFLLFWGILLLGSYLMWAWVEMPARRLILGLKKRIPIAETISWRIHFLKNRNSLLTGLLLTCLLFPLYIFIDKDKVPVTIDGLVSSAAEGKTDSVRRLVEGKIPVNSRDALGNTPLIAACWSGQKAIVSYLIEKGADLNIQSTTKLTPLIAAVSQKQDQIALLLLEHGANPNVADINGSSPLITAAWQGNLNLIRLLIANGADINYQRPSDGITALAAAKAANQNQAHEILINEVEKVK